MKLICRGIWLATWLLTLILCTVPMRATEAVVQIRTQPSKIYIDRTGDSQYLVFAFELSNNTDQALKVTELRMMAFDAEGWLLNSSKIDSNGGRPSIEVLGPRQLEPHKSVTVFNPFDHFPTNQRIAALRFEFDLAGEQGTKTE